MLSLKTTAKSGIAIIISSVFVLGLAGCSDPGGPKFASAGTPAPPMTAADSKEPFDNTDVYKGNNADVPAKAAMAVEGLYRTANSYETRQASKQDESLEPSLQAEAQKKTYAAAKEYVYQGSMPDAAVYEWFKTLTPETLPAAGTSKYTYEILVEKSKVAVSDKTAVVSLEDSYSVKDGSPVKIPKEKSKTIKLTKVNGEWLIDVPGTIEGK